MIHSALLVTLGVAITAFMSFWSVVFSIFPDADNKIHKVASLWARILLLLCNTKVKIIASPAVKKNIHEIRIVSRAADILTRTENILHPDNPKTSYLAVLSAIATLRQILQPVKIGT